MFKKPGKKLKTLAKILFVLLLIIPVLFGIVLILGSEYIPKEVTDSLGIQVQGGSVIGGIVVILFGFLFAWLSTIMLYTIGELSDDLEITRRATVMIYHKLEGNKVKEPEQVTEAVKEALESIPKLDEYSEYD